MKIRFEGDIKNLTAGIQILCSELGWEVSEAGIPVRVEQRPGNLEVSFCNENGLIRYDKKIHFFRALGLFMEAYMEKRDFNFIEEPQFKMNGIMIDASRNAVIKVDSLKTVLRKMALMGLNMTMLYTEDTYTIENRPYFGYMRGRYSSKELKEVDDYADIFGIEIVPCIQTLAHLTTALRWNYTAGFSDTGDILLVGEEQTYEFVEGMIRSVAEPLRSKKIHIGMDEAFYLGLGKYLRKNGYKRGFDILSEHLRKVMEITKKYGLETMIWSDMYFRLASDSEGSYDAKAQIPEDVVESVPKTVKLVYWDYYNENKDEYAKFIKKHKGFGREPVFAGGIWTWAGNTVNYKKTFAATNAALEACKEEKIKEVFATMWGDNGNETNIFSGLLGLQLFAEHGYAKVLDMEKLKKRFEFCTGGSYEAFISLSGLDEIEGISRLSVPAPSNPSKYLLWQDVLLGLFDKSVKELKLGEYYQGLANRMEHYKQNAGPWNNVFEVPQMLCSVLAIKSEIGIRLKACYDGKDLEGLKAVAENDLEELGKRVEALRLSHRKQWIETYKAIGWEPLDIRYGGLLARIDTARERLKDYMDGRVKALEELEEERLYFDGEEWPEGVQLGRCNEYSRIATACSMEKV